MSPAPFACSTAVESYVVAHNTPTLPALAALDACPLHRRLVHLAARRLEAGALPPRCYYWWGGNPPVRIDGRAI